MICLLTSQCKHWGHKNHCENNVVNHTTSGLGYTGLATLNANSLLYFPLSWFCSKCQYKIIAVAITDFFVQIVHAYGMYSNKVKTKC